jgi:5-methylcytosine-specific restriction endonuclease McrA
LVFENHGKRGSRGAWHVDHKYPLARGGSDEPHNWITACISCKEEKNNLRPGEWTGMEIPLGPLNSGLSRPPRWMK